MSDELEQLLRGALRQRADEITPASSRHHDIRPARRSHAVPVLLAAGCVMAVAIGTTIVYGSPTTVYGGHSATPTSTLTGYAGYQWRLATVTTAETTTLVSPDLRATASFFPDGTVVLADSVNALTGRYDVIADGFSVHGMGTTMALYTGNDPAQLTMINAINSIASGQNVDAAVLSQQLTLKTTGYTMTFQRVGPADPNELRTKGAPASSLGAATNEYLSGVDPSLLQRREALMSYKSWLIGVPEIYEAGFVESANYPETLSTTLLWAGESSLQATVRAEAERRGIAVTIKPVRYSRKQVQDGMDRLWASVHSPVWKDFVVTSILGPDLTHDGLVVQGHYQARQDVSATEQAQTLESARSVVDSVEDIAITPEPTLFTTRSTDHPNALGR